MLIFAAKMRKIVKDSAKLLSANVVAQAIGIIVYPLLSRLYSESDFGLLSLFTSIGSVLVILCTAEYHYAIVLPAEEKKARAMSHVCLMILGVVTGISVLFIPFSKPISRLFDAPELAEWLWLLPIYVGCCGMWNILNYIYIRGAQFTRISSYQVSQSVVNAGSKIGFGYSGFLSGGLIVSSVIAPLLAVSASIAVSWRKCLASYFVRCPRTDYGSVAREFSNFPKFNLPRSLVNSVGLALPVWLLTRAFGTDNVGYLSLALVSAFMPLNIIARAFYQIFYQRITELVQHRQPISRIMARFIVYTGVLTVLGLVGIYWFIPQLVTLLFGANWLPTASVIRHLYPALVFVPVCGTICFLSDIFAKQKVAMWMEICYVIATGVALFAGIRTGSFLTAISAYSWTGFVYMSIQLVWFVSLIRRYQQAL